MSAPSPVVEYARLLRQRRWRAIGIAALVVVAAVALLGGFRKASGTAAATVAAGKTLDAGALRLTPVRAWLAPSQPGREPLRGDTERYLVLRLEVENRTDSGSQVATHLQSDVRWLAGGASTDADDDTGTTEGSARVLLRADDHSPYVALPPRLPATIDLVWELPAGAALPTRAQWRVARRNRVEQTYLTREGGWLAKGDAGTLQLPVDNRLASRAAP